MPDTKWDGYASFTFQRESSFLRKLLSTASRPCSCPQSFHAAPSSTKDAGGWIEHIRSIAMSVSSSPQDVSDHVELLSFMDSLQLFEFVHRLNESLERHGKEPLPKSFFLENPHASIDDLVAIISPKESATE